MYLPFHVSLELCTCLEHQIWPHHHPLRYFQRTLSDKANVDPRDIIMKLESLGLSLDRIDEISATDLGAYVRHPRLGGLLKDLAGSFPKLDIDA